MDTDCAPLVADLFLFCYERDFMMSLSDDKQPYIIDAYNTISRYLDDIFNINYVHFNTIVSQIYPVPYFRGYRSCNNFYRHSLPFR